MWMSTPKGKTIQEPTAAELLGALLASAPGEAVMLVRDLMSFVHVCRREGAQFVVTVRDGSPDRQRAQNDLDLHDVAAALVAFATDPSFARAVVERAPTRTTEAA
jgi:hypothetical protein